MKSPLPLREISEVPSAVEAFFTVMLFLAVTESKEGVVVMTTSRPSPLAFFRTPKLAVLAASSFKASPVSPPVMLKLPPKDWVTFWLSLPVRESPSCSTAFSWATFTASVSLVPAARLVICRVYIFSSEPTLNFPPPRETAPMVEVHTESACSAFLLPLRYPARPAAVLAWEPVPKATPPVAVALEVPPRATPP